VRSAVLLTQPPSQTSATADRKLAMNTAFSLILQAAELLML